MIFVDTGYLVALADPRDELHERASAWAAYTVGPLLTTEYVLWEAVNRLSSPLNRRRAHTLVRLLRSDPAYELLLASPEHFEAGLALHGLRPDKRWTLTDCISFALMSERGLLEALAYDIDFEQAGFRALLRHPPPQ